MTEARLRRGLAVLRSKRAANLGRVYRALEATPLTPRIFSPGFTSEQLAARPLYPFLPPGVPESFIERMGAELTSENPVLYVSATEAAIAPAPCGALRCEHLDRQQHAVDTRRM